MSADLTYGVVEFNARARPSPLRKTGNPGNFAVRAFTHASRSSASPGLKTIGALELVTGVNVEYLRHAASCGSCA
jgi:hypothetical protein